MVTRPGRPGSYRLEQGCDPRLPNQPLPNDKHFGLERWSRPGFRSDVTIRGSRPSGRSLRAAALALFCAAATPSYAADVIDVLLDRATILKMPPHADTIVVGNPIIADVTTLKKNGLVVVTGKGFGETNLIFLDGGGQALSELNLRVEASPSLIVVQRGLDRESYACQPRCQPTVSLGDAQTFLTNASSQISSRNALALPTTNPSH